MAGKNPIIAVVLGLFLPYLSYYYIGRKKLAVIVFFVYAIAVYYFNNLLPFLCLIFAFDCYRIAKKTYVKEDKKEKMTKKKTKEKDKNTEIKCKCNQCGKIWHYLTSEKSSIESQARSNALIGCGTCGSPTGAYFSNKSIDYSRRLEKFDKCPKCGSRDIKKREIKYAKK